jgi:uncharacterized membrane protein
MFDTENGTHADILPPAVKDEKNEARPYKSNFACVVTIDRKPDELYRFWRDFSNLPRVMENIASVTAGADGRSHWTVRAPGGVVEWDAELVEDQPGKRLAWRSVEGADVENAGLIEFRKGPQGRGTEVRALVSFKAPMGGAGRALAGLMQKDPHIQAKRDLRRFKQLMETGEIAVSPHNQDPPAS